MVVCSVAIENRYIDQGAFLGSSEPSNSPDYQRPPMTPVGLERKQESCLASRAAPRIPLPTGVFLDVHVIIQVHMQLPNQKPFLL